MKVIFAFRDKIKRNLEKRMQQSLQQLGSEKDSEIQQLVDRVESLQNHIDNICQQHEELMLRAENDKQQALLLGELISSLRIVLWDLFSNEIA